MTGILHDEQLKIQMPPKLSIAAAARFAMLELMIWAQRLETDLALNKVLGTIKLVLLYTDQICKKHMSVVVLSS